MEFSEENKPIKNDISDEIMKKVSSFPSAPRAGIKLRALLAEEDVSTDEIEGIVRHDPGLATNVLRLANSAFFGLPQKVGSLKHAVTLLGLKRFAQIAVSAGMSKTMNKAVEGYGLSPGELWLHSIAVSNTAEAMAKYKKFDKAEEVFTPALLHDMGKLILGEFVEEELQKIRSITANGVPLVNAVRWHHNPERNKNSTAQSDMVYLSNLMCELHAERDSDDGQFSTPSPIVLERLGIKIEQYEGFSEKARNWMKQLSDMRTFD